MEHITKQQEKLMAALATLNANILTLTSVVSQVIPDIQPPSPAGGATEAQVQAAADAVAAQTTLLQNALTAVAPPAPAAAKPT